MNIRESMKKLGRVDAAELQTRSGGMSGTELYEAREKIPLFAHAVKVKNMLHREIGFTCISPSGRVVRLLQKYDSEIFPQPPEELSAQWGFKWSTRAEDALPFRALATSPYNRGEVCSENGVIYRSRMDGNVVSPSAYPQGWEEVPDDEH